MTKADTLARPRAILINLSGIGDIISSLVVAEPLLKDYEVHFLIPQSFSGLLKESAYREHISEESLPKGVELVVDLTSNSGSRKLVARLSAQHKVGRYRDWVQRLRFSRIYSKQVQKYPQADHIVEDYYPILKALNLDPPKFPSLGGIKSHSAEKLASIHIGADKLIRMIPVHLVVEACEYLHQLGYRVRLLGTEADRAAEIISGCREARPEYAKTSLQEVVQTLADSDLVIAPDSGLFHLAAALERPTLGLFGPNLYSRSGSLNPKVESYELEYECRPCNQNRDCAYENRCMQQMQWSVIRKKLDQLIKD